MFKKYNFIENKYISNFIKKVQRQLTDNVNEVDCFICFMPSEKNNQINKLSKFSHIIQKCKCNAKIHLLCLNIWIKLQMCIHPNTSVLSLQHRSILPIQVHFTPTRQFSNTEKYLHDRPLTQRNTYTTVL